MGRGIAMPARQVTRGPHAIIDPVAITYPLAEQERVLKLLVSYGIDPHEREFERVWVALTTLSGEDIGRLVEQAKMDMNYVLLWAEQSSQ